MTDVLTLVLLLFKPEGSLFITTINKSQLSYIFGIVVAERVLGIVPTGTHDWEKFIPPEELERLLESSKCLNPNERTQSVTSFKYDC